MAYFHCSNVIGPAITAAPQRWYKALREKMEFCFATETFHNPTTMALCDLVLPLSAWTEHDSVVFSHYGLNIAFQGAINKAVQVGECKSDIEQMLLIGQRLHPEYWNQFTDETDYLDKRWVRWDHTFESLREKVVIQKEEPYRKYELGLLRPDRQPGFMTPSGRVELYSNVYDSFGDDALPYFVEPHFSPVSTPELYEEYPLILTTGARTYASFHSEHRQVPSLRAIVPDPIVELHPETAANLGIKEGDWCWIENQFNRVKQRAHLTETIDPRVAHAMHGWWFPEQDGEEPNLFGNWQSNINMIMPHKMNGVLGYGDTFKAILCKVYKAE
jgi:anaerobic selenocysteine-containing dehydrogenase